MFFSLIIVATFSVLLILAVLPTMQQVVLRLSYRLLQLAVIASTALAAVFSIMPAWVPAELNQWIVANGLASQASLDEPVFWFTRGLGIAIVGVICLVLIRHLCDVPQVSRHLRDIKVLMGSVSQQVTQARTSPEGQGALRRAVETMHEFFRK